MKKALKIFLLITILSVAIFFRVWQLNDIPPGLYPDVAINGNEALESLKTGDFKVFYPENNGREGLIMWLVALSFKLFGATILSMKILVAGIGILTIVGFYFLAKELLRNFLANNEKAAEIIALLSSFLLAISFWHVLFSRLGFRAIIIPLILVFGFYFLLKGLRQKSWIPFAVSGIFFGLGFYTYISYRFIVFLVPLALIPWFFIYKGENQLKTFWKLCGICLLFIFLTALPLGIYFLGHPADFFGRAAQTSILSADNPVLMGLKSLVAHLGMFNFVGDGNWRHNLGGSPQLLWPVGILFLVGFFFSARELILSIKNKNYPVMSIHLLLLAWFFLFLAPGVLTSEGIPHALRTIGVIPAVFVLAGMGGYLIFRLFEKNLPGQETSQKKFRIVLLVLSFIFLAGLACAEYKKYFTDWAQNKEIYWVYSVRSTDIGKYLVSIPYNVQKFIVVNEGGVRVPFPDGLPMPTQTTQFIENAWNYNRPSNTLKEPVIYIEEENLDKLEINGPQSIYKNGQAVIILLLPDDELMTRLKNKFPQAQPGVIKNIEMLGINYAI